MAKKKPVAVVEAEPATPMGPRPRLHKLRVSNFRCIGRVPVEIELDDIVILVGPNNAGKTSLLRAYEIVMEHESLTLDDFPDSKIETEHPPTIELETVVFEGSAPGMRWVDNSSGEMIVKERWTWESPGKPKKVGWEVGIGWHAAEGPWGAAQVAQARRPMPHRVSAFQDPTVQAGELAGLLKTAISQRIKEAQEKSGTAEEPSEYKKLLSAVKQLQQAIAVDATKAVDEVRDQLTAMLSDVFPGYDVTFDARPDDDIEKTISLFRASPLLKMGPAGGHQATIDKQGSGAQRTLLWAALRILAERAPTKGTASTDRPHLLLMDEPENCLHPDAIREACRVLYDLPKTKQWQVMITTHSPVFVDLSRDNTSILRVERTHDGLVQGTTVFKPRRAKLDNDDRVELKLLNLYDPYVAEFFFGGRTIVVEGDTEYTAFKFVMSCFPGRYSGVHVVRARGKACVKALCKILEQFGTSYAVLHDSDRELTKDQKANGMWTENASILAVTEGGRSSKRVRLLAAVPNFEEAFFGKVASDEKPYQALRRLREDTVARTKIAGVLDALLDSDGPVVEGTIAWNSMEELSSAVSTFDSARSNASSTTHVTAGQKP